MGNEASRRAKWECNGDDFKTIQEVTEALVMAGLESSNLIIGIDFTKSNEWTGKRTFNGHSLHAVNVPGVYSNPYEDVIQSIGETLKHFGTTLLTR
ncbi:hypothetical protein PINS_up010162 [Pythium insidiosum]|nr:hypothetical protein PINS_up010162 [Pythium insidiosum]